MAIAMVGIEDLMEWVGKGYAPDLAEVDQSEENAVHWKFEYAEVESVSYTGHLSGGWADSMVTPDQAIIYVFNGSTPALISRDARLPLEVLPVGWPYQQ